MSIHVQMSSLCIVKICDDVFVQRSAEHVVLGVVREHTPGPSGGLPPEENIFVVSDVGPHTYIITTPTS